MSNVDRVTPEGKGYMEVWVEGTLEELLKIQPARATAFSKHHPWLRKEMERRGLIRNLATDPHKYQYELTAAGYDYLKKGS